MRMCVCVFVRRVIRYYTGERERMRKFTRSFEGPAARGCIILLAAGSMLFAARVYVFLRGHLRMLSANSLYKYIGI